MGRKAGTSATAGKKSRKISATINGIVYSKRVFSDQQYLLVSFAQEHAIVTAWKTEDQAMKQRDYDRRDGSVSHYALAQTI
jgi:hypothetical protein